MASTAAFHGLFNIEPTSSQVTSPPPAHQKSKDQDREIPSGINLKEYPSNQKKHGPTATPSSAQALPQPSSHVHPSSNADGDTDLTPSQLELSRPASPTVGEATGQMQRWDDPPINRWRVLSCCLIYFHNGMNDSATGALIPYMEKHYHIGFAVMSLIFVGQAAGFIVAAFFNNVILSKLGRAKMLMASEVIMISAYIILLCTPPYPAIVASFFMLGYAMAMTIALNNVFCGNLQPSSVILGVAHGSYGIGGIVAPISATALASNGILWSRFYFVPFGLALVSFFFAGWAFWNYQEDSSQSLLGTESRGQAENEAQVSRFHDLKLALKSRVTILGAAFIFAYQGAEVSISGWVISFLIEYRGGDPASVGYVTAGFWGGITIGRFVLTRLTPRFGERNYVIGLVFGTMAFQLLGWLVPNVITNAVAVSILGLLLGPVYPCANSYFMRLLPRSTQTSAMGFIASAGSSGGAVAPFTTGILAQAVGTYVLHPVCLALYVVMLGGWIALPKIRKRTE